MADVERELIAKVVREQNMPALIEAKIDERFFVDDEHLAVLDWMREHFKEYGSSPSEQALLDNFPTYKLPKTPEPLTYYVDQIRKAFRYEVVGRAVADAAEDLEDGDADTAARRLEIAINSVNTVVSPLRDHNLTDPDAFDRLFDYYAGLTRNPGSLRGYETGWPTLDLATMGYQNGQLVTFVGPPKGGKSTVMLSSCDAVVRQGHDTLLVSFEMSYDEQVARWVGLRAHLNYRRLLKGKMNDLDEKRLEKLLKHLREGDPAQLILSEDISSTTTVGGIIAKIQQHKPSMLFIDGVYLMDDENGEPKGSSAAITNITRSLKRTAQVFQIPIAISTQTLYSKMRGQTIKPGSIGYSSSFGQDSDTVIAVEPREDADSGELEHWLKVLLSRSGPQVETQIDFDWATSTFTEYETSHNVVDPDEDDTNEIRIERGRRRRVSAR